MANRIKNVWMQLEGAKIRASPCFKKSRLSRPTSRVKKVSAAFAWLARIMFLVRFVIMEWPLSMPLPSSARYQKRLSSLSLEYVEG